MKKRLFVRLLISVFFILSVSSCSSVITAVRLKNATEPPVSNYLSESKKVRFIGVVHVAKPELYENIKNEIQKVKNEGYVLFWEYIEFKNTTDIELRKVRKMLGFVPSPEGHARKSKADIEKGYVVQNNELFLGLVNNKDFNVDLTPTELVQAYESKNGEIILNQADMSTPIDESITETLPTMKVLDIILDYRNKYLAKEIEKSKYNKIVVLYGALHQKGTYSSLRELDASWKKAK